MKGAGAFLSAPKGVNALHLQLSEPVESGHRLRGTYRQRDANVSCWEPSQPCKSPAEGDLDLSPSVAIGAIMNVCLYTEVVGKGQVMLRRTELNPKDTGNH